MGTGDWLADGLDPTLRIHFLAPGIWLLASGFWFLAPGSGFTMHFLTGATPSWLLELRFMMLLWSNGE